MAKKIEFIRVRDSIDERHARIIQAAQDHLKGTLIVKPKTTARIYLQIYIQMPAEGLKSTLKEIKSRIAEISKFYNDNFNLIELDHSTGAGMIMMTGNIKQVSKACNVELIFADSEHSPIFGHLHDYGIPVGIADLVHIVAGLNSFLDMDDLIDDHKMLLQKPPEQPQDDNQKSRCPNEDLLEKALNAGDYAKLYNYPTEMAGTVLDGDGIAYSIIQLGGSWDEAKPYMEDYFKNLKVKFPDVKVIKQPGYTPGNSNGSYETEIAMNLEVPGYLLPKASFHVYFCNNDFSGLLWAMCAIVHGTNMYPLKKITSVISLSWAFDEPTIPDQVMIHLNNAITEAVRIKGIAFVAASGDYGSTFYTHTLPQQMRTKLAAAYPASHPDVTAAGATNMVIKKVKTFKESVWNQEVKIFNLPPFFVASGGSFSKIFPIARIQKQFVDAYLDNNYPDKKKYATQTWSSDVSIACNSDMGGYYTVSNMFGECVFLIGTSGSTCMWASLLARVSHALKKPIGPVNDALYYFSKQNPNVFNDIEKINNCLQAKNVSNKLKGKWIAAKSWDPGTGLGSPNGKELLKCFNKLLS